MGNIHSTDVITPEMVDAIATPVRLNPDERQDAPPPDWMLQIVKRQFRLAKKFNKARRLALEIYNIALEEIETINEENGTDFSLAKFLKEFDGYPAYIPDEESEE